MPAYFVLQPNGRLARFSTVVDAFTDLNMTVEEALETARRQSGRFEAEREIQRALQKPNLWDECIDTMHTMRKGEALEEVLKQLEEVPKEPTPTMPTTYGEHVRKGLRVVAVTAAFEEANRIYRDPARARQISDAVGAALDGATLPEPK